MTTFDTSSRPDSQPLRRAFDALVKTLNERRVRYAIIGGMAMMQHVRTRTTEDVDALLIVPQVSMPGLFEALADRGFIVDLRENIRQFRDIGMTALHFDGVIVDLLKAVIPAYAHVLDRAEILDAEGKPVSFASAEGLIVTKLVSFRLRDQADIAELISAYGEQLDLAFIRTELATFAKPDDPRWRQFEAWVRGVMRE